MAARLGRSLYFLVALFLFATALYFRVVDLSTIPGITNDEGMHALEVHRFIQKQPLNLWMPSGRAANPFYIYVAAIVESVFPQSILTLRLPALLSSILTLFLLFFWMLRISKNESEPLLVTLLVATSPLYLAHSRVGVDGSMAPLASVLLTSLALSGRTVLFLVMLPFSLLFHPFEILLFPLVLSSEWVRGKTSWVKGGLMGLFSLLAVLLCFVHLPTQIREHILQHRTSFSDFLRYWHHVFAAVSGVSAIESFSGGLSEFFEMGLLLLGGSTFSLFFLVGIFRSYRERDWGLFLFIFGIYSIFFLLPFLVSSDYVGETRERYFLPLLIPLFVAWARIAQSVRLRSILYGYCVVGVWVFGVAYLQEFKGGGNIPTMFRAGAEEPATAILNWVSEQTNRRAVILTEGRMTLPLIYLALNEENIEVIGIPQLPAFARSKVREVLKGCHYIAAIQGEYIDQLLKYEAFPGLVERKRIQDFGGRSLIHIYQNGSC